MDTDPQQPQAAESSADARYTALEARVAALEAQQPAPADVVADPNYPKHLARFEEVIGGPREIAVVENAADEAAKRADGYKTHHELDADAAKEREKAKAAKGSRK